LAAPVKRADHRRTAERTIVEVPAVFTRERHALRHTLVDDVDAQLRQAIYVCLACAEVTALHRVVEQTVDAVAVALIILRCIDTALRGNAVRAARRIVVREAVNVVAELAECRGCSATSETRTDHDDFVFPLVRRIHEFHVVITSFPLGLDRARRDFGIELHSITPSITAIGNEMLPMKMAAARMAAIGRRTLL